MKKWITLLLAAMMVLSLAACGTSEPEEADGGSDPVEVSGDVQLKILDTEYVTEDYAIAIAKDNEALLEQVNDALAALTEDGSIEAVVNYYISGEGELPAFQQDVADDAEVLTLGTSADFPPYEFYDGDDIVGIDAAVAGLIADQLGMKLEITDMNFDAIIPSVVSGKVDLGMAGLTVTDERLETVNFSDSYSTGTQVIVVQEGSDIVDADALFEMIENGDDIQIGVQLGTTGDIYAMDDFGEDHVQEFAKYGDVIQALATGKLDCVIMDNAPAENYVAAING